MSNNDRDEFVTNEDTPDIVPTWRDMIYDLHEFLNRNLLETLEKYLIQGNYTVP